MAESITRWVLSINMVDGAKRPCGSSFYVPEAEAQAYSDAADDAARELTQVFTFIDGYVAMSDATYVSATIGKEIIVNPRSAYPANTVLRGNKLQFSDIHNGRTGVFNIPARKAASYTQDTHGLSVSIAVPLAMNSFVDDYNTLPVLDADGNASSILSAKVVD